MIVNHEGSGGGQGGIQRKVERGKGETGIGAQATRQVRQTRHDAVVADTVGSPQTHIQQAAAVALEAATIENSLCYGFRQRVSRTEKR